MTAAAIFLWAAGFPAAALAQGDAASARDLYLKGDFAGAARIYEALVQRNPADPALRYNLGNALFKSGGPQTLGRAIAEYSRAFATKPRDADIRFNLDFALRKAGERLVPPGVPGAVHRLFHLLSGAELLGLQFVFLWTTALLASAGLKSLGVLGSRRGRRTLAVSAVLWAATLGWWAARRAADPGELGVVLARLAEARSGPRESFSVAFTAPEGRRVQVLSAQGEWTEIGDLKEGFRGWLPSRDLEKI